MNEAAGARLVLSLCCAEQEKDGGKDLSIRAF